MMITVLNEAATAKEQSKPESRHGCRGGRNNQEHPIQALFGEFIGKLGVDCKNEKNVWKQIHDLKKEFCKGMRKEDCKGKG